MHLKLARPGIIGLVATALLAGCSERNERALPFDKAAKSRASLSQRDAVIYPSRWSDGYGPATAWQDGDLHPRMLAQVDGVNGLDIVGFGNGAVCVSLSTGTGFTPECPPDSRTLVGYFGVNQGWTSNKVFPRTTADVDGDGLADVVGFKDDGVWVAIGSANGFSAPTRWVAGYGTSTGWQSTDRHPRMMADVDGDGRADIVGFGNGAACVSLSNGSSFAAECAVSPLVGHFGVNQGWTSNSVYPRMTADVNADGKADIVGFKNDGVWVALANGSGFDAPTRWVTGYGTSTGWQSNDLHPRMLADLDGNGSADIVGFGNGAACVSLAEPTHMRFTSECAPEHSLIGEFGVNQGWTNNSAFPRMLAQVDGTGAPEIVGFANVGVLVSTWSGSAFTPAALLTTEYGYTRTYEQCGAGSATHEGGWDLGTYPKCRTATDDSGIAGWRTDKHLRMAADVSGDGTAEIVGFGEDGVVVTRALDVTQIRSAVANVDSATMLGTVKMLVGQGVRNITRHVKIADQTQLYDGQGPCTTSNGCEALPNDPAVMTNVAAQLAAVHEANGYATGGTERVLSLESVALCGLTTGNNVLATRIGSIYPKSYIEVMAHMDSHPHAPGAGDNASGSAAVMEMARLIALMPNPPRHSIRFINLVGHEEMPYGVDYETGCENQGIIYHLQHLGEGESILASFNLDGIGWSEDGLTSYKNVILFAPHVYDVNTNAGRASSRIADLFRDILAPTGVTMGWRKATWPAGDGVPSWGYGQSGNVLAGLPVLGIPTVQSIGSLPYNAPHYHNVGDTIRTDAAATCEDVMSVLNCENMKRTTQQNLAAVMALDLLDGAP